MTMITDRGIAPGTATAPRATRSTHGGCPPKGQASPGAGSA